MAAVGIPICEHDVFVQQRTVDTNQANSPELDAVEVQVPMEGASGTLSNCKVNDAEAHVARDQVSIHDTEAQALDPDSNSDDSEVPLRRGGLRAMQQATNNQTTDNGSDDEVIALQNIANVLFEVESAVQIMDRDDDMALTNTHQADLNYLQENPDFFDDSDFYDVLMPVQQNTGQEDVEFLLNNPNFFSDDSLSE
ncbi:hypothetical protein HDU99_003556 [Rhizoclosmatium hyalinum]|nr:hypothetical protein HDU99_003556 [Rhizoclosmatium hyalinum]